MADPALPEMKKCRKCGEAKLLCEFYRNEGRCKPCMRAKAAKWRADNPEKYEAQKPGIRAAARRSSLRRRKENPEYIKEWRELNRDRVLAAQKRANDKFRSSIQRKIESAIAANVRNGIRNGSKQGRRTFELLGYTVDELMSHLERQFQPGMSWGNYGRGGWNIDHKIPLAAHNYESPDHADFKRAWALSNLQPLWEPDNIRKSDKLDTPFQPSLAI